MMSCCIRYTCSQQMSPVIAFDISVDYSVGSESIEDWCVNDKVGAGAGAGSVVGRDGF